MTKRDDSQLVADSLKGDTGAYGELVERHQKAIFNAALRMVRDYDEARDIVQEVFIKAYERLNEFKPEYKFFSWIYKMTINQSINLLKRSKNQVPLNPEMKASGKTPESDWREKRMEKSLENAIATLSIKHRVVIVLRHFADLSYRELSFVLDIPERTVKSRLFAARQQLGKVLSRKGLVEHEL